ncbi:hypothetical protein RUMHYD_01096 [Blautia hydrogenotrophica DSM 10507]|uniref:Uncharacterized protein n=1 Tax=Blautia hydrogenotrophica (strain DSM 10507 / JCM 14656 / S5a33) TaxID=476272 RepID=C0CJS6_BLAHS|nr:hypothetical protein RUMHYD_01096 [Blautia hydrogenotrophica DSM 10507]
MICIISQNCRNANNKTTITILFNYDGRLNTLRYSIFRSSSFLSLYK